MKKHIRNWQLKYKAKVVDIETGTVGRANNYKSENGAIEHATQDLFSQLKKRGLLDPTRESSGDTEVAGTTAEG